MDEEVIEEIEVSMEEWGYKEDDISYFLEKVKDHVNTEEIEDYLVLNGSESNPSDYDEDVIDLQIISGNEMVLFLYTGGNNIEVSYWPIDNLGIISIDENNQRISYDLHFDIGTGAPIYGATYDREYFKNLKDFLNLLRDHR